MIHLLSSIHLSLIYMVYAQPYKKKFNKIKTDRFYLEMSLSVVQIILESKENAIIKIWLPERTFLVSIFSRSLSPFSPCLSFAALPFPAIYKLERKTGDPLTVFIRHCSYFLKIYNLYALLHVKLIICWKILCFSLINYCRVGLVRDFSRNKMSIIIF